MNGDEVLSVLREIRDEAKLTNVRLESLEGRVDFLERRVANGFAELEMRLATEIVSPAKVTRELRDVVRGKFAAHDKRLKALEKRNGSRKK